VSEQDRLPQDFATVESLDDLWVHSSLSVPMGTRDRQASQCLNILLTRRASAKRGTHLEKRHRRVVRPVSVVPGAYGVSLQNATSFEVTSGPTMGFTNNLNDGQ